MASNGARPPVPRRAPPPPPLSSSALNPTLNLDDEFNDDGEVLDGNQNPNGEIQMTQLPMPMPSGGGGGLTLQPPSATYHPSQPPSANTSGARGGGIGEGFDPFRQWGAAAAGGSTSAARRQAQATGTTAQTGRSVISREPEPTRAPTIGAGAGAGLASGRSVRAMSVMVPEPDVRGVTDFKRVYYRIYSTSQGSTVLSTQKPLHTVDPSLSFFHAEWLPPPYTAHNIKRLLANRENIHLSRCTLYLSAPRATIHAAPGDTLVDLMATPGDGTATPGGGTLASPRAPTMGTGTLAQVVLAPGSSPQDPLHLVVQTSGDPDEDLAAPLELSGRLARGWRTGCIGRSIVCLCTCPCTSLSIWCDICMEDCQGKYARREGVGNGGGGGGGTIGNGSARWE